MKSYIQIQLPAVTIATSRGATPSPAGFERAKRSKGRLPGPAGVDAWDNGAWKDSSRSPLEETAPGGALTLELDSKNHQWRIRPPALARWKDYLPATSGKWARSGDEITILDAAAREIHLSLACANRTSGRASYGLSLTGRYEHYSDWKRLPKPLRVSSRPPLWYGLAVADKNAGAGPRSASAVVMSEGRWFTFSMPQPTAVSFRGYSWNAAFVLLTGYLDRGDLVGNTGSAVDYELSLGAHWYEQAGALNPTAAGQGAGLLDFVLKHEEMFRALGLSALESTCVDYDERHVIIADLAGARIRSGVYAYTGECLRDQS